MEIRLSIESVKNELANSDLASSDIGALDFHQLLMEGFEGYDNMTLHELGQSYEDCKGLKYLGSETGMEGSFLIFHKEDN